MELAFKLLSDQARLPTRANADDAGLDLYASENALLAPGQRIAVGTGLAVEIPVGQAGLVLPRSGLAFKHGIALVNAPGLIDAGYRGELRVLLLNTDHAEAFEVKVGERIAQLLLVAHPAAEPVEVDELGHSERGDGGFGSSGR